MSSPFQPRYTALKRSIMRIDRGNNRGFARNRQGAVAVEFAIVLPIIMIVFLGLIMITQMVFIRDSAQQAAYEGARRGMAIQASTDSCKKTTVEYLEQFGIVDAVVTIDPVNLQPGTERVTVNVEVPMKSNSWIGISPLSKSVSTSITLTRKFAL